MGYLASEKNLYSSSLSLTMFIKIEICINIRNLIITSDVIGTDFELCCTEFRDKEAYFYKCRSRHIGKQIKDLSVGRILR